MTVSRKAVAAAAVLLAALLAAAVLPSCSPPLGPIPTGPAGAPDDREIGVDPSTGFALMERAGGAQSRWAEAEHRGYMQDATAFWGLPAHRAATIAGAADDPDIIQSRRDFPFDEIQNPWISNAVSSWILDAIVPSGGSGGMLNDQRLSHAMLMQADGRGPFFGDMEQNFSASLLGGDGDDMLFPGKSAADAHAAGDGQLLDHMIGAASHYFTDAMIPWHVTWFSDAEMNDPYTYLKSTFFGPGSAYGWNGPGLWSDIRRYTPAPESWLKNAFMQLTAHNAFEDWISESLHRTDFQFPYPVGSLPSIWSEAVSRAGSSYFAFSPDWSRQSLESLLKIIGGAMGYHGPFGKALLEQWFSAGCPGIDQAHPGAMTPGLWEAAVEYIKVAIWFSRGYLKMALDRFGAASGNGGYDGHSVYVHTGKDTFDGDFAILAPGWYDKTALQDRGLFKETAVFLHPNPYGGGNVYNYVLKSPGLSWSYDGNMYVSVYYNDGSVEHPGEAFFVMPGYSQIRYDVADPAKPVWSRHVVGINVGYNAPPPPPPPFTVEAHRDLGTKLNGLVAESIKVLSGVPPYVFHLTGLPPGLSFGPATGTITGRPEAMGGYRVSYRASDSLGRSYDGQFAWTITVPDTLTADPITDKHSAIGEAVSGTFTATQVGSQSILSWKAYGLPPGLSLNAKTGAYSGTIADEGDRRPYPRTYFVEIVVSSAGTGLSSGTDFCWTVDNPNM